MSNKQKFYGKYRGCVVNNMDPDKLGRLQAQVPDVYGDGVSPWALPCVPVAGNDRGMLALPEVGANVWVEFEGGDPDKPIWVGCFWGPGDELPGTAGEIVLRSATGAELVISGAGIRINNGKGALIELAGPSVSINHGALQVV